MYNTQCDYLTVVAVVAIGVLIVVPAKTFKIFITAAGAQTLAGWSGMQNGKQKRPPRGEKRIRRSTLTRACKRRRPAGESVLPAPDPINTQHEKSNVTTSSDSGLLILRSTTCSELIFQSVAIRTPMRAVCIRGLGASGSRACVSDSR